MIQRWGPLLVAAVVSGCRGDATDPVSGVVRSDSAGVEIVESSTPLLAGPPRTLGPPQLRIGSAGADTEFFRISDAVSVRDGFVVAESHQVRGFTLEGEPLWTFGREGDGPREFRRVTDLEMRGDSIAVVDGARRRVVVLAPDGTFVRGFQLEAEFVQGDLSTLEGDAVVALGSFPSVLLDDAPLGLHRPPLPLLRMSWAGEVDDTLATVLGAASVRIQTEYGVMDQRAMFGHTSHVVTRADRILIGDGTFLGFVEVRSDGTIARIVRAPRNPALTPELLEAEWSVREGFLGSEATRELRETTPLPEQRPAFSAMLISAEGDVWLGEHRGEYTALVGSEPQTWQVFNRAGEWVGPVEVPARFRPLHVFGDRILGVFVDEVDVEHAEVRSLQGASRNGR